MEGMSRADWIRAMNDEEMAKWFADFIQKAMRMTLKQLHKMPEVDFVLGMVPEINVPDDYIDWHVVLECLQKPKKEDDHGL